MITIFENIITNNEIKFNDLEKKIFKFVSMLGCLIIKIILEKQDKKILESIKGDKRFDVKIDFGYESVEKVI